MVVASMPLERVGEANRCSLERFVSDGFVPEQRQRDRFERAGVWRRLLAICIDGIIVSVVLQVLALVLFPLSHGRIQFAGGIYAIQCSKLDALPAGVVVPADFNANVIIDCQHRVFGLLSARMVRVQRVTRDGAFTKEIHIDSMLDADGVPVTGLSLGILLLPLLLAWRFMLDGGRGTPGRRICRIRLAHAADGGVPPTRGIRRRYLLMLAILSPLIIWPVVLSFFPVTALPENLLIGTTLAAYGPILIVGMMAWRQVYIQTDTWYDRFAGTSVVRAQPIEATPAISSPATAALAGNAPSETVPSGAVAVNRSTPPLPPAGPPARGYLLRHWRGQLSLPMSFWVNGVLLGTAAGPVLGGFGGAIIDDQIAARPLAGFLMTCALWLGLGLLALWQSVGIWRSATLYRASGDSAWGRVAQVLVVIAVASALLQFFSSGLPQIAVRAEIAGGDTRLGPHQFRVLASGEMLEFSGGIKFGVAAELENFLSAMPDVKTVRLNSPGGRIGEAQRMSDVIKARKLSTLVENECLSACTIVFLGGADRVVTESARIGFHQPSFPGLAATDRRAAIMAEQERLEKLGLSREFAQRANQAEPGSMWFPDHRELISGHFATRIVTAEQSVAPAAQRDVPSSQGAAITSNGSVRAPAPMPQGSAGIIPQDLTQWLQTPRATTRFPSPITGAK